MTGHNYSEESNIFTAAAARSWYRQAAFPCSTIIISGGNAASRWWIVYSSCVNAKSTTYLYCHHGRCLISVPFAWPILSTALSRLATLAFMDPSQSRHNKDESVQVQLPLHYCNIFSPSRISSMQYYTFLYLELLGSCLAKLQNPNG